MSEEKKTVELKDEELERVTGGDTDNTVEFAYSMGYIYKTSHSTYNKIEDCYVENGVKKYKIAVVRNSPRSILPAFVGYIYLTEDELNQLFKK